MSQLSLRQKQLKAGVGSPQQQEFMSQFFKTAQPPAKAGAPGSAEAKAKVPPSKSFSTQLQPQNALVKILNAKVPLKLRRKEPFVQSLSPTAEETSDCEQRQQ